MLQTEALTKCCGIDKGISSRSFLEEEAVNHVPCVTLLDLYMPFRVCVISPSPLSPLTPNCHHVGPTQLLFCILSLVSKDEGILLCLNINPIPLASGHLVVLSQEDTAIL